VDGKNKKKKKTSKNEEIRNILQNILK